MSWNEETAALLKRGDPAAGVPNELERRVAARLDGRRPSRVDFRWVVVVASLGAFGVFGANVVRRVLAPPSVLPLAPVELPAPPKVLSPRSPARPPSTVAEEAALLQRAMSAIDRADGRAALAACEEHARRFPAGELMVELQVARVRALILQGDDVRALEELGRLPTFAKTTALTILEAQALARLGRCAEFQRVVASLEQPDLAGSCTEK